MRTVCTKTFFTIDKCKGRALTNTLNSSLNEYNSIFIGHNFWGEIAQTLDEDETKFACVKHLCLCKVYFKKIFVGL